MQGRVPVDPESGLEDRTHVLEEGLIDLKAIFVLQLTHPKMSTCFICSDVCSGDVVWNASLSKVDLRVGTNSYYKLQVRYISLNCFFFFSFVFKILANNKGQGFHLFRSWGRTGLLFRWLFVCCLIIIYRHDHWRQQSRAPAFVRGQSSISAAF